MLGFLSRVFSPMVQRQTAHLIERQLRFLLPSILITLSKSEFEVPQQGVYHTEFAAAPVVNEFGMLFGMALYQGPKPLIQSSTPPEPVTTFVSKKKTLGKKMKSLKFWKRVSGYPEVSERSWNFLRSASSFSRYPPLNGTSLQLFLSPTLLEKLNPILLSSVAATVQALDLAANQTISVPLLGQVQINATKFNIHDFVWSDGSGLSFVEKSIQIDAKISAVARISYESNTG